MAAISRVVTQSRSEAVIDRLARYIAEAGLKVNDRLPAERELATSLGVSRPILREALRHLAALGVLEAKTGSGTYLRSLLAPTDRHLIVRIEMERQSLMQLLELRRALETEVVALVAARASEAEIEELEGLVDKLERDFFEHGDNPEADKAFHLALYRCAGNPLFLRLIEPLWEALEQFWQYPLGKKDFAKRTRLMHRAIYERIRARDPEGARTAMREMLAVVEEDLRA